jgi:hypothetical protein
MNVMESYSTNESPLSHRMNNPNISTISNTQSWNTVSREPYIAPSEQFHYDHDYLIETERNTNQFNSDFIRIVIENEANNSGRSERTPATPTP